LVGGESWCDGDIAEWGEVGDREVDRAVEEERRRKRKREEMVQRT
jgi:hypothetical protein